MQQTENYKLNLIETTDVFSPQALNENAEKTEAALDALAARAVTLENCRIMLGRYYGAITNDSSGYGQVINLGERPLAVFVCASASNSSVNYTGFIVLDGKCSGNGTATTSMELRDNGFWVYNVLNGNQEYRFIAFFGDFPMILQGKTDV